MSHRPLYPGRSQDPEDVAAELEAVGETLDDLCQSNARSLRATGELDSDSFAQLVVEGRRFCQLLGELETRG